MQCTNTMLGPKSIHDKLGAKMQTLSSWVGKNLWCEIFNTSKTLLAPKIQFAISCKLYKERISTCIFFKETDIPGEETN